mgnify:CR=1 FL=1
MGSTKSRGPRGAPGLSCVGPWFGPVPVPVPVSVAGSVPCLSPLAAWSASDSPRPVVPPPDNDHAHHARLTTPVPTPPRCAAWWSGHWRGEPGVVSVVVVRRWNHRTGGIRGRPGSERRQTGNRTGNRNRNRNRNRTEPGTNTGKSRGPPWTPGLRASHCGTSWTNPHRLSSLCHATSPRSFRSVRAPHHR